MQATVDMIATARRTEPACPAAPCSIPATFGSMKETLCPAMKVKEMKVETLIRCSCVSPSSAISALYGVQKIVITR